MLSAKFASAAIHDGRSSNFAFIGSFRQLEMNRILNTGVDGEYNDRIGDYEDGTIDTEEGKTGVGTIERIGYI